MSNITKVTPVRIVDRIEPCLPFWCDQLGYAKRAEVQHEGALGFALLENEAGEIMLQTRASLAAGMPQPSGPRCPPSCRATSTTSSARPIRSAAGFRSPPVPST